MPLRRGRLPAIPSLRAAPGSRAQRGSGVLSFQPGWLRGRHYGCYFTCASGYPRIADHSYQIRIKVGFLQGKPTLVRVWCVGGGVYLLKLASLTTVFLASSGPSELWASRV